MTDAPQVQNPLLQRIQMPGETFTIPSGGSLYHEGILDNSVKNGEIRVFPMTAIDDITLKTPDMLFSGDAVREVFGRCIPSVLTVDEMFARDVDFLLICLRKVSYGETMPLEYAHTCDKKAYSYNMDTNLLIQQSKKMDPTTTSNFSIKLDNGQIVEMRPVRFGDFVRLMQINDIREEMSVEEQKQQRLNVVQGVIRKVDEIEDPGLIFDWLAQVPPKYLKRINENIEKTVDWGPDFVMDTKCKNCKEPIQIVAPLNPLAFFT